MAWGRQVPEMCPLAMLDVDYRAWKDKLVPTVNVVMAECARTIEAQPAHYRSHTATSRKHLDTGAMPNA